MSIIGLDAIVRCDRCGQDETIELSPRHWPKSDDEVFAIMERQGWTWGTGADICPSCGNRPTKEDIADYKAYHAGEGIHTP